MRSLQLLAIVLLSTLLVTAATVTVRSGNGAIGGTDASIHFLLGPPIGDFGHLFTPTDFSNAQNGTPAYILSPNPLWIRGLSPDPSAQWIGTNPNASSGPGNTALYALRVQVPTAFSFAALTLVWAADDGIGETAGGGPSPNTGIYLNGTAICGNSFPIGFNQE